MRGNFSAAVAVAVLLLPLGAAVAAVVRQRARRSIATAGQRATYDVLHTAGLAAEPLRTGLTTTSAAQAAPPLRTLIGAAGLAISDGQTALALDGAGGHHREQAVVAARRVMG